MDDIDLSEPGYDLSESDDEYFPHVDVSESEDNLELDSEANASFDNNSDEEEMLQKTE